MRVSLGSPDMPTASVYLVLLMVALGCARAVSPSSTPLAKTSCSGKQSQDSSVYDTTQVAEKPSRRSGPAPEYPVTAMQDGIQGTVIVSVVVEPSGRVNRSSTTVVQGVDSRLDWSAIHLVRESWFWPGCRDGAAVRVRIAVPVTYTIR